ncbi:MAG: zinc-binding dehydrogenase [Deltaproteobacteria bacterium]|nr:zinc-binding dehydrogenase [Deltaproteobacteria bacterium]MBW1874654.1 zinc-binding dehydrogenase [Deltaproteobacteria bacterium]MBW2211547.1 zinc-binding dehydrogenase [Deltaproteobacteria bacterium]MBW2380575.1 zinc-binding dehydrogenase [Deltaproteobacteria bacterium]MBW2550245.1 zinc-binding dehydrogenase [Deltaproteobacteria bacterium]
MIQQANIHGPGQVALDESKVPEPGPRDAVVRVAACGVCGTDVRYVRMGGLCRPMPIGHELSGVIESVGAEVSDLAAGTRVVLNPTASGNMIGNGGSEGGFTQQLLVRNAADGGSLFPIPDELPMHLAALSEPLGVGMNAVNRADVNPGDKIAVFGAGPIGLSAIATLRDRGVEDVVAIDLSPRRLELAMELGARATIHAGEQNPWVELKKLHGEAPLMGAPMAGTDAYIEASGAGSVITDVLQNAKGESSLTVVALHEQSVNVSFLWVMMKQMTIRGAMEYPADYTDAVELLTRWDLSAMITHRFPLERIGEAIEVATDPNVGGKVMIDIDQEVGQ